MKTIFLLTYVPNPRMNKRISLIKSWGEVKVICTRRKSQNIWEPEHQDVEHLIYDLDLPSARHLFKRFIMSSRYKKYALRQLEEIQPDIIYVEGLDCLQIANQHWKKHKKTKIVYEVADLRECFIEQPKGIVRKFIKQIISILEKKCIKNMRYLVVTSMQFYEKHYQKMIDRNSVIFMPNVPNQECFINYKKKETPPFTVGFIGGIRYLEQMKLLVDAAEKVGCNVLFAGAGGTSDEFLKINEYCKDKTFVKFTGRYEYAKDIANLYGMVDCVYSVYDADNPNVRIALPNKLYEAVLCRLPIVVAKGTYLSQMVEQWGVGVSVDHKYLEELVCVLDKLKNDSEYYHSFERCCEEMIPEINLSRYNRELERKLKALVE